MRSSLDTILRSLGQDLTCIQRSAVQTTANLDALRRETESLKVDVIKGAIQRMTESQARDSGLDSLVRDKGLVKTSLGVGIVSAILGGLAGKDLTSAAVAAVAGLDGLAKGLGEGKWYVSLTSRGMLIARVDRRDPRKTWVSWGAVMTALETLRKKALAGESLGNFKASLEQLQRLIAAAPATRMIKLTPRRQ